MGVRAGFTMGAGVRAPLTGVEAPVISEKYITRLDKGEIRPLMAIRT